MKKFYSATVLFALIQICSNQEIGKPCNFTTGAPGVCSITRFCKTKQEYLARGYGHVKCINDRYVVCCVEDATSLPFINNKIEASSCPPVDPKLNRINKMDYINSTATELAIQQRCIDILNQTNFCQKRAQLIGQPATYMRVNRCYHTSTGFIIGGEKAQAKEFRHQALLGFVQESNDSNVLYECGGTLISDEWVMTAAHCIWNKKTQSKVSKVKLGILLRTENRPGNIYNVKNIKKYPTYTAKSKFDDIALLQLDRKVQFSESIVPACLPYKATEPHQGIATGWGLTVDGELDSQSNNLMKVKINSSDNCQTSYKRTAYDPERKSQLCYGESEKDTCQGDSGGPLQIQNKEVFCTYTVFGITSFGKECGDESAPGIYTRVYYYLDWILENVWPTDVKSD